MGLWKAGRKNNLPMFLLMLLINSVGIIPIGYLIYLKYSEDKVKQIKVRKKTRKSVASKGAPRLGKKKK